jgi:hypothetical protein
MSATYRPAGGGGDARRAPALGNECRVKEDRMVPLLASVLVGVAVKAGLGLLAKGAKAVLDPTPAAQSFSAQLDRARATTGTLGPGAGARAGTATTIPGAALADRAQLLALETGAGLPDIARAHGAAIYRRLEATAS